MSNSCDVIVIGSGAGGGTLVHRLAPSGKRILHLERGGWLPREPQNWRAEDVFVDNLTDAEAVELQCNEAGTAVTGVVARHDGQHETFYGDLVVVSCGAANSARPLLASASDKHPRGLAHGSDQVGRNFMFHNSQAVLALSKEENPTIFQKTLGVNDFYFTGGHDFEFPLGNIQMVGKSQAPMFRGDKPGETRFAPTWSLEDIARHAVDFWLSTEDLPRPENRVTLMANALRVGHHLLERMGARSAANPASGVAS